MKTKNQLSILEFSKLTGINRDNLRYYDRIGLLSAENRGSNRYRYYSRQQLNIAYLIINLRAMGVGIEEIKQFVVNRTPEKTIGLFDCQDQLIQDKINQLNEVREIMKMNLDVIKEAQKHKEGVVFLETKKAETIFLCPAVPKEMNEDDALVYSYNQADANGINLEFPFGVTFPYNELMSDMTNDNRYYFRVIHNGNESKNAGKYVVIYGRIDPNMPTTLYKKLIDYIDKHHLKVCGNIYEEYPLDNSSTEERTGYYVRIEVPVCDKK